MPKVSILTPAYNSAKYLPETIESVLAQTFQDFEMIIVDDGSTDNTKEVVEAYVKNYPGKIRYIYQQNAGPAAARNTAIKNSTGEYLALLDSDDLWFPNRLEEGVKILDTHPEVGLVHSRTKRVIGDIEMGGSVRQTKYLSGMIYTNLILRKAHISCLTALFRRKCIEDVGIFDEARECIGVEDRELWLRISKKYPVYFIDKDLGIYRIIASGISRNQKRMLEGRQYNLNKHCPGLKNLPLRHFALARTYKELADEYLEIQNFCEAKKWYKEAIKNWPFYIWPWINYIKCVLKVTVLTEFSSLKR